MDKRPIFLIATLLSAGTLLGEEAYRWVDEDGVVHYSDRPREGADKVVLPEANTTTVRRYERPSAAAAASDPDESEQQEEVRYESLTITSPDAEETLWNIEGVLKVALDLKPGLDPGHQVRVYFDGEPQMVSGTSFQLQEVWRGAHNLQAEVLDAAGNVKIRSQPRRFYVQQNTVAF
jgi:hypothetical protein